MEASQRKQDLSIHCLRADDVPDGNVYSEIEHSESVTYRNDPPAHQYDVKAASVNILLKKLAQRDKKDTLAGIYPITVCEYEAGTSTKRVVRRQQR